MILNDEQRRVVDHPGGPLLVLACPGSGKTRCISERIIALLDQEVSANNILAITFTNKAANEMASRVRERGYGHNLWISTFHSFGSKVLRRYASRLGYKRNFTICDSSSQKSLMKKIIKKHGLNPKDKRYQPEIFLASIEGKKNRLLSQEDFELYLQPIEAAIFSDYERTLKLSNSMDFGDLIYLTVKLFEDFPEIKDLYADRFKHILVDEMQDTNVAQLELVKHLASKHNNIISAADQDQLVYHWRGACLDNILRFDRHFPQARETYLSLNYRSTPEILEVSEKLIEHNPNRKMIKLRTNRPSGEPVKLIEHKFPEQEAEEISNLIQQHRNEGYNYRNIAILCRTNALTRTFEECFRRRNIPYVLIGAFGFYDRREVRTGLAFMKFIANPEDALSFEEIVNVPSRGVGPTNLMRLLEYALERQIPFLEACCQANDIPKFPKKAAKSLSSFVQAIELYNPNLPHSSLAQVFEQTGFLDHLRETDKRKNEYREDNVLELLRTFSHYCHTHSNPTIDQYLQEIMLITSSDKDDDNNTVRLMTIHAAKGLEFGVVFIPGMEEDIFPHKRSIMSGQLEEERRVAYVAATRAKDYLYLSKSRFRNMGRHSVGSVPSRFLIEMGLIDSKCWSL